jgi:4-amino-4-deoxy-L-arabinose transferase-like glycosyltransferase
MLDLSDISPSLRSLGLSVAVALVAFSVYFVPTYDTPFYTKGEAREAVLVQAMIQTGNYVLPFRNGTEIPSKPPLFHWLGALASIPAGGVTEAATRLPSVLAAAIALGMTAWLGRRWFGSAAGIAAAVILGSSVTFFVSATTARVDMVLAAAITLALVSFQADYSGERRGLPRAYHAAVAAAVLAKGPIGFVLPWAIVVVTLALFRDRDYAARLAPSRALAWLALPTIWYVAAFFVAGDGFVAKQIMQENFQRLVDAEAGATGHVKPFYAHLPLLLGGLAPWTLLAPVAVVYAAREAWATKNRSLVFLLVWLTVPLVLLSFAGSKRAVYLLPSYPALGLIVGWWWTRSHGFTSDAIARAAKLWTGVLAATAVLLSLPLLVLLLQSAGLPIHRAIAPLMSEGDRANLHAVARALSDGRIAIVPGVLVLLGLTMGLVYIARRRRWRHAIAVVALLTASAIAGGSVTLQRAIARTQTVAPFVRGVAWVAPSDSRWGFFRGVSYPVTYYADRPVPEIESPSELPGVRPAVIFATGEDVAELLDLAARSGRQATEIGRFTFADNPERVPLVALALSTTPGEAAEFR